MCLWQTHVWHTTLPAILGVWLLPLYMKSHCAYVTGCVLALWHVCFCSWPQLCMWSGLYKWLHLGLCVDTDWFCAFVVVYVWFGLYIWLKSLKLTINSELLNCMWLNLYVCLYVLAPGDCVCLWGCVYETVTSIFVCDLHVCEPGWLRTCVCVTVCKIVVCYTLCSNVAVWGGCVCVPAGMLGCFVEVAWFGDRVNVSWQHTCLNL